jgi:large subunit ribosomal protein L4
MAGILKALGVDSSALIVTSGAEENITKSASNLPVVKTMPADLLNVVDLLSKKKLLMTVPAVRKAEAIWGEKASRGGSNASV